MDLIFLSLIALFLLATVGLAVGCAALEKKK